MAPPSSEVIVQVIGKIPLFRSFSPSQVRLLLSMCEHRVLAAEEVLCKEGASAEQMFLLAAGELVWLDGNGLKLETVLPVASTGEVEMVTGQPYAASLQAAKPSHIFTIPRIKFERMARKDGELQLKMYKNMTDILVGRTGRDEKDIELAAQREEKQRYESRIAALERQLYQQGKKIEAVLGLLSERAEMSREEAEFHISDQLKGLVPRVLVVDDEPDFRRFVRDTLAAFMVVEAQTGKEALEIIHEERLDLIIADIRMPEMDGCTLLTNLRSKFPGLPVLAVSGHMGADDLESYDFDGFIDKPIETYRLQDAVEAALAKTN
ncbi:MAG: response regulator [Gemmatimonadetes bacterium]|jgi:CheY-like chemotaxis protein|nr:response regulator [Gemmatimonadota bacterium]